MTKLIAQAIGTLVIGTLMLGLLIFLPAGTFDYWQAWVFIIVFMLTISVFGVYFSIKDPALIERRKQVAPGAQQSTLQNIIAVIAFGSLLGVFVFCGLDRRFGWSHMPPAVSILGDALEIFSFFMFYVVFKANSFGGSSILVEAGQKVSSTGPYALVRHPMYVGTIVMGLGIILGLASWWAMLIFVVQIPVLVLRILDEERVLENELVGYKDYEQKVRYRLLPYVW